MGGSSRGQQPDIVLLAIDYFLLNQRILTEQALARALTLD